jgi:hypothetical protein
MLINDDPEPRRWAWQGLGGESSPPPPRSSVRVSEPRIPLSADDTRACPLGCGRVQETFPIAVPDRLRAAVGRDVSYFWRQCPCEEAHREREEAHQQVVNAEHRQRQADDLLGPAGLKRQAEGLTLDRFDPRQLAGDGEDHPYTAATNWLARITGPATATYTDPDGPPAALYFYSPGPGRGKTHLAAGLAWELRRVRELVCFLHEEAYCSRLWSCGFEKREEVLTLPGERAWLTVLDDLGRLNPGPGVQNAWYAVINRRWLRRKWLLITSNFTLDELRDRGTICEATYSRLYQMTRGAYVVFDGADQRLVDPGVLPR